MEYLTAILFVVALLLFAKYDLRKKQKAIEKAFEGRAELSEDSYYQRFFQEKGVSKSVAVGVRAILEEQLATDLGRLNRNDDFSKNLAFFFEYDSMVDVEIVCAIEKRFGIKIRDEEAAKMCTVEEIVQVVHEKVSINA